ncbi:bifunctional tRNA (5-methylaminomethyl-2-thiouridine)(34)-methyltransferase MnmD/FAD-dependent 5-carboxymethylaminomethyl-2-thiouridine(34) oxidoreductase MnmC [Legionella erythra]|uniref:tRNA 5-methylaminomethyl-2-thiouridine biosynthesis bifunctional protein MnmC n=1 Tax=Legionella erythra TaxID=448 RepID=A0A0W0TR18_LEGER|nr:bifunctional tRNA (5-methylaminomethyl-2-thiouridine)(34)-methyltransferase MnmD/FAD-dependent 5-carboxymethylaminomethyl-2-thiouridine(34) oxidoreductase MnmC [Legionella erythra]KTC98047.1 tRNA 5-methylaminomethyl-2-thiouridine biosynthesis bifunctional protein MnmC [Legionella erythra]
MSSPFTVIRTADLEWRDGLPYSPAFDDVYFSREDGCAEKQYVFIEGNRLKERFMKLYEREQSVFTIAETGFGTGLNFLLTWQFWRTHAPESARLFYFSCEKFPLTKNDLASCLQLWPSLQICSQQLLEQYPVLTPGFHRLTFEQGRVHLILMLGEAQQSFDELLLSGDKQLDRALGHTAVDAWYLDGFAPGKNEHMWTHALFQTMALLSHKGTTAATYSAAASVKNGLKASGFTFDKRAGYGKKRHMLTAELVEATQSKRKRQTPWFHTQAFSSKNKRAIIVGAGLAGCFCAHALSRRGWSVRLLDEGPQPAAGASGNERAVFYPKLSAYRSPLTEFMLAAFLYAHAFYKPLAGIEVEGDMQGILQLACNDKELKTQQSMREWLHAYPQLAVAMTAVEASERAGLTVMHPGLFIPLSGWLNSRELCHYLLRQSPQVQWFGETAVTDLHAQGGLWHVNGQEADVVIITSGFRANQFPQTLGLPIKPIGGQISFVKAGAESGRLTLPLCGDGHVLPAKNNRHAMGATYHLNQQSARCHPEDDGVNLLKISPMALEFQFHPGDVAQSWAGVRGATPDYLPLVGAVPIENQFLACYAALDSHAERWIDAPPPVYPGLYVCAGFGSRGLTTIPISAEWLAGQINGEPGFFSRSMVKAISPSRFLLRQIVRSRLAKSEE